MNEEPNEEPKEFTHNKKAEDMVAVYRKALATTIKDLIEQKSSVKKTMALEMMWLDEQKKSGRKCDRCGTEKDLTVDHIIPESLLVQLGLEPRVSYVPQNYGVLCRRCNLFKANRLDYANPKTKPLLKEFVDSIL